MVDVEVTHINRHGISLLCRDRELFLSFEDFPWFSDAPVAKIFNVEERSPNHFYWPDLDIDIGLETIEQRKRERMSIVAGKDATCNKSCPCWGMPTDLPRKCPYCLKAFKRMWIGVDAHYRAKHEGERQQSYEDWWASICSEHRGHRGHDQDDATHRVLGSVPVNERTVGLGEIVTRIELENATERGNVRLGLGEESSVRRTVVDGLVDTGAVMLLLPQNVVERLGLPMHGKVIVSYADERKEERAVAGPVGIRIGNRAMNTDCVVGPPLSEPLIGQIVLGGLDLIADCTNRTVGPRPESPDYPLLKLK